MEVREWGSGQTKTEAGAGAEKMRNHPRVPENLARILATAASQVTLEILRRPKSSLERCRTVWIFTPSAEALMVPTS